MTAHRNFGVEVETERHRFNKWAKQQTGYTLASRKTVRADRSTSADASKIALPQ